MTITARALLAPVWRMLPWRVLAGSGAAGLLLAGVPRLQSGEPDPWLSLFALRGAALVLALGLAFLLDDPARHITSTVPVRRPLRAALRLALATPWAALCWAAAVLLVPAEARPPVGALTLEAIGTAVVALAAAALVVQRSTVTEPGVAVSAWLLCLAAAAFLLLPDAWSLLVTPDDPRWEATHDRWAMLLAVATAVGARACMEPLRAWRPASFRGRAPAASWK